MDNISENYAVTISKLRDQLSYEQMNRLLQGYEQEESIPCDEETDSFHVVVNIADATSQELFLMQEALGENGKVTQPVDREIEQLGGARNMSILLGGFLVFGTAALPCLGYAIKYLSENMQGAQKDSLFGFACEGLSIGAAAFSAFGSYKFLHNAFKVNKELTKKKTEAAEFKETLKEMVEQRIARYENDYQLEEGISPI